MKNNIISPGLPGVRLSFWMIAVIFIYSCNSSSPTISSFYYSGNTKIYITVIRDTLGVLLRDTVLNPQDTSTPYFNKVIRLADSSLASQGYDSARNLENDSHIKLVVNPAKKYTKSTFFNQVNALKSQTNRVFVDNVGYLVRVKGTNRPLILTDEIIVQFKPGTNVSDVTALFNSNHLSVLSGNRYDSLQYLIAVTKQTPYEVLEMSHKLKENQLISFVEINFIYVKKSLSVHPVDAYFNYQWNLASEGSAATEDADIDADRAWDITMGSNETIIAIVDLGFDTLHSDLEANILRNTLEVQANGSDDDGDGYIDDYLGWNFDGDDNNLDGDRHGTAVLGVANAVPNNTIGIAGSCPNCRSLPIKSGHELDKDAKAIDYAILRGAKIINFSWEYGGEIPLNVVAAANRASDAGIVTVFAMANDDLDYCRTTLHLDEIKQAIFVSRSTSKDTYDHGGKGGCMSVLAPSGVYGSPAGYLKLLTTDMRQWRGYNTGTTDECLDVFRDADYTNCFWGTSASAPLTAGVVGLILSVNKDLTPKQVKYLIQDCADKIDTVAADYSALNGESNNQTHGYGRLNAYEAVKTVSPDLKLGGRNGVDIFLRDNKFDWGNTEKPSTYSFDPNRGFLPCWESMDIKVDAPPYEIIPPVLDNNFFENLPDNNPIGGQTNKVYVRVRNRGFNNASSVTVKLHWVHAGAGLPPLPSDFWDKFPDDATVPSAWNFLEPKSISNLEYSGASVANSDVDPAQVVSFDFNAPVHDPSTRNHYCLMAIISSPEDLMPTAELKRDPDRLIMDYVTSHYNNATHRNYNIETMNERAGMEFFMYNPLTEATYSKLEISFKGQKIPVILSDSLEGKLVYLKKNEKKLVRLNIDPGSLKEPTEITIQQLMPGKKKGEFTVIGGISYLIMPSSKKSAASKSKK